MSKYKRAYKKNVKPKKNGFTETFWNSRNPFSLFQSDYENFSIRNPKASGQAVFKESALRPILSSSRDVYICVCPLFM